MTGTRQSATARPTRRGREEVSRKLHADHTSTGQVLPVPCSTLPSNWPPREHAHKRTNTSTNAAPHQTHRETKAVGAAVAPQQNERTMSRQEEREGLRVTLAQAASYARVSVQTWRRWEEDPTSVSPATAAKCDQALRRMVAQAGAKAGSEAQLQALKRRLSHTWHSGPLTPRQAYALIDVLGGWAELDLQLWFEDGCEEPLHQVGPFAHFDHRVMMLVGDNKAFAAEAQQRCLALYEEIERGLLPFQRDGCYFDEVLMAAALIKAGDLLSEAPEMFEGINVSERPRGGTETHDLAPTTASDADWEQLGETFDNLAQWEDWEVPVRVGSHFLPFLLAIRHPYRWFDLGAPRPTMRETLRNQLGLTDEEFANVQDALLDLPKPTTRHQHTGGKGSRRRP